MNIPAEGIGAALALLGVVVLAGLRRVPRILRWVDRAGEQGTALLGEALTAIKRSNRLLLKLESAADHYLRTHGVEPPESTGEQVAVQRVVEGDPSAVVSLIDRLDPEESLGTVRVLRAHLQEAADKLGKAIDAKQATRDRDAPAQRKHERSWRRRAR